MENWLEISNYGKVIYKNQRLWVYQFTDPLMPFPVLGPWPSNLFGKKSYTVGILLGKSRTLAKTSVNLLFIM